MEKKKKKIIISIVSVIILIMVVSAATYAYLLITTNEGIIDTTGSGELSINYQKPGDLTGKLIITENRDKGLKAVATASLNEGSIDALFNMYITPTALTNLNIPALKWEVEAVRNEEIVCSETGDFSNAEVNTKLKILDGCPLSTDVTTFTVYIWLDANLITTFVNGSLFGAKIGAESVPITGGFEEEM